MADEELRGGVALFKNTKILRFNVPWSPKKQPRQLVGERRNKTRLSLRRVETVKPDAVCLIDDGVNFVLAGDGQKEMTFALLINFTLNGPYTISPCLVSPNTGVEQGDNDSTLGGFKGEGAG